MPQRHRRRSQRAQLVRPAFQDRGPLHEIEHAEARREPRRARRRQHVVGAADIVADRLRRVGPEEDRAGIADLRGKRFRIRGHDFQMLGGDRIRERHGVVEAFHQDDRAEIVPRGPRDFRARQGRELRFHRALDLGGEPRAVGDQDRLRVDVVLGLRQQIGGDPAGIAGVVGDHQHFGRAGDHVDADLAEHQPLGGGDIGVAGADDLGHRRDRRGAVGQRRHRLRAADAIDLGDAAEMRPPPAPAG